MRQTTNIINDLKQLADQNIEAKLYKTSTAYVLKPNKALRDLTNATTTATYDHAGPHAESEE
ncbi:hypothetical protein MBANPS3_006113 [Mucor bainieri]